MTLEDTKTILLKIACQYPTFKPNKLDFIARAWLDDIVEFSYEEVLASLKMYNATNTTGFAPSISQIINGIHRLKMPASQMSEGEAWDMVYRALSNSAYHAGEEFEKLPPVVQKAIGSSTMLRSWAMTDVAEIGVVQSNFMRSFRSVNKREFESASRPRSVDTLMAIVEKKKLEKEKETCKLGGK